MRKASNSDTLRPANWQCCLHTHDPVPWKAGVDDSADADHIAVMHSIRGNLSYNTTTFDLIKKLRAALQIDSRTQLGGDIQRCLLSNAGHRLTLLSMRIDPAPWRTLRERIRDAWCVFRRCAVAIHVRGSVCGKPFN